METGTDIEDRAVDEGERDGAAASPAGDVELWRSGVDGDARAASSPARVALGLSRLQGVDSLADLVTKATREACRSLGFDRAVLFRLDGSHAIPEAVHFEGDPEWAARVLKVGRASRPELNHLLPETEMVRRRVPILVDELKGVGQSFQPLIEATQTQAYVAAPIAPSGRVIGLLHADCHYSARRLTAIDRDSLWGFAAGLGYAVERVALLERLRGQRSAIRQVLRSAEAISDEAAGAEIGFGGQARHELTVTQMAASMVDAPESRVETLLTPRELEVLGLMAGGATNAAISDRLVISEGTVKSHVKHILRKLRAANRAEAVSRYVRMRQQ